LLTEFLPSAFIQFELIKIKYMLEWGEQKHSLNKDAEIVHTVHDEIIVESPSIMAPEISEIVKEVMEGVFTGMFPNVPFKVNGTLQQSWGVE